MSWEPYRGEAYLDFVELERWCRETAETFSQFVSLEEVGTSRHGRPLLLLTVSGGGKASQKPAFWLDGGTHASEWTGVMAALYSVSQWVEGLCDGDEAVTHWFRNHTAYVLPCISPDGYQAMFEGMPYLRSTLRPPVAETHRVGLEPADVDGDGAVRWMRWKHPAGSFVPDEEVEVHMRPRRLDDDPAQAYFLCTEGHFLHWDGVRWTAAAQRFGLDLNRNFPSHWRPFSMFGMDGGRYPLSEPESRAVVEAVAARPNISGGLTNHTYTGVLLSQPYRGESPLGTGDIELMERLGRDAVRDSGYGFTHVHPDFVYDPKKEIVGVWADTMSTVFGFPGYTLELWDPYAYAGVKVEEPARMFRKPREEVVRALMKAFALEPDAVHPWKPFHHPQLGEVELGGLDYLRTVRNPPESLLAQECQRGHQVVDRLKAGLPRLAVDLEVTEHGEGLFGVQVMLENLGFLPTSGLLRGEEIGAAGQLLLELELRGDLELLEGQERQALSHLDGWGNALHGIGAHTLYTNLPTRGHRTLARWVLRGQGELTVRWRSRRAGAGERRLQLTDSQGAETGQQEQA